MMRPIAHAAVSGMAGSLYGIITGSVLAILACFLGGIIIDIDHILDYYLTQGKICVNYSKLYKHCKFSREGKMYLIFHSYELLFILWFAVWFFHMGIIAIGFLIGMSIHLLSDQIVNDVYPPAYLWIFRMRYGFTKKILHNADFRSEFNK